MSASSIDTGEADFVSLRITGEMIFTLNIIRKRLGQYVTFFSNFWAETQFGMTWHIGWPRIFLPMWHTLEASKIVPFI